MLNKVWVYAGATADKVTTATLELPHEGARGRVDGRGGVRGERR